MIAVLPDLYLACYAALTTGAGEAALEALGVAVPAGVTPGVPQGGVLPYLRLDEETERESALLADKSGTSNEYTQSGTAWATSKQTARLIAAAAVAALITPGAVTLAGYRVRRPSIDLFDTLPANPAEPGVYGAAFRVRFLVTPS